MPCVSVLFWGLWIYIKIMKNDRFLSSTLGRPWTLLDNPSDLKFFVVTFIMYINSLCEFRFFSTTGTLRKNSLFLKKILGRKTKIWYFRGQYRRKSKNKVKKRQIYDKHSLYFEFCGAVVSFRLFLIFLKNRWKNTCFENEK